LYLTGEDDFRINNAIFETQLQLYPLHDQKNNQLVLFEITKTNFVKRGSIFLNFEISAQ
jgi:hypothetical protein